MNPMDAGDEWLMARVARGHDRPLEVLMKRYHRPLLAFIGRQTDSEVEDIYQETWMRVARARGDFDPSRKFSSWLFSIAANLCRDSYRRRSARPVTVDMDTAPAQAAPEPSDEAGAIGRALAALPPQDREIISLRYYQGFREKEVAEILGIPVGTVKSRSHEAVKKLKKIMSDE